MHTPTAILELRCRGFLLPMSTIAEKIKQGKGFVYFLKGEGTNMVKIGKTSNRPSERKNSIQNMSPVQLYTLGLICCPNKVSMDKTEKELHELFAAYRSWGEWFCFENEELSILKAMIKNRKKNKDRIFDKEQFTRFWTKKIHG